MGQVPCRDCGTNDMPLDTSLTPAQWAMVAPDGGMLCASCIVRRASNLPKVIGCCLRIVFADDYDDSPEPGSRFYQSMLQYEQGPRPMQGG